MDPKSLEVLEWPQVVALLAKQATNAMGRDRCAAIALSTKLDEVSAALRITSECKDYLRLVGPLPLGGFEDLRPALKRADQGLTLAGPDLLAIAHTLRAGKHLKATVQAQAEHFEALADLAAPIAGLGQLSAAILAAFDASGELADNASPDLGRIRQRIREAQSRVRQTLSRITASHANALQDTVVTLRGDRFVLPVRADAKSQVPGIVHDQSASGATLYVEPIAVVELNNALRQAQLDERAEIERILTQLTDRVRADLEPLAWNCAAYAEIDFAHAKARLSELLDGSAPRLARNGAIALRNARHPLLAARLGGGVVPTEIALGAPETVLLITGPNTGGKTVALKTLGLCVLMTQAGLHAPVAPGSQVSLTDAVFADIGDEQSLAQSLSTFSGHLTNIMRILEAATPRSLVLLDELGAGTDPAEGAALGRAIIETLLVRGSKLVATTHYGELKLLRYQMSGVQNAAVEFDLATLSPTYRLLLGVSGQSNAVAIAERLGLPEPLIQRARELLERRATDVAVALDELERDRQSAAEMLARAERLQSRAEGLKQDYETRLANWQSERRELEAKAREKVEQQVRSAQGEIAAVIRELQGGKTAQAAQKAKERLGKYTKAPKAPQPNGRAQKQEEITIGKTVFVPKLNQNGRVLTLPDADGNVSVQVGILKVTLHRREVTLKNGAQLVEAPRKRTGTIVIPSGPAGLSCDLRGLLSHEAIAEADKYLDQAYGAQLKEVTLIHGAGTGALRDAIRAWLKENPVVAAQRPGEAIEGGDGVTIVTLR